jgi:hypothetical protein
VIGLRPHTTPDVRYATYPTTITLNTDTAGVPPAPPEAHLEAGFSRIARHQPERHFLSSEFFTSDAALEGVTASGSLHEVLSWFNGEHELTTVGTTRQISPALQVFFGYDRSKPNGHCFFVDIDRIAH